MRELSPGSARRAVPHQGAVASAKGREAQGDHTQTDSTDSSPSRMHGWKQRRSRADLPVQQTAHFRERLEAPPQRPRPGLLIGCLEPNYISQQALELDWPRLQRYQPATEDYS